MANETNMTRFIVLFQGRSGSTYLTEALAAHPDVSMKFEILAAMAENIRKGKLSPHVQAESIERFFSTNTTGAHRAQGFKTKFRDIAEPDQLAKLLRDLNVRVVLLRRRNRVKVAVSWFNAMRLNERTGDWNLYTKRDRPAAMAIDPVSFRKRLAIIEDQEKKLVDYVNNLRLPTLCLHYEDLLLDEHEFFRMVLSFLNLPPCIMRGKALKNTSDKLCDVLLNFDEIRSNYVGTPYEQMFGEVLVS